MQKLAVNQFGLFRRFMVMEVYDDTMIESMKYYHSGADMPFNFRLLVSMSPSCGGTCVHRDVSAWMLLMPKDRWPNFVVCVT